MSKTTSIFIKSLTCFLLFFAIQLVALPVVRRFSKGLVGDAIGVSIFLIVFSLCLLAMRFLIKRWGDGTTLSHSFFKWQEWKWIILAYLANLVLVEGFLLLSSLLGNSPDNTDSLQLFHYLNSGSLVQSILFLLTTALTQPFLEELLFRGIIAGSLEKYSPTLAILSSAFLFGIAHNGEMISQHLLTGLVLGTLYIKRRNLYSCVAVHILTNMTVTCLYLLLT